jgi:hypothetical protein
MRPGRLVVDGLGAECSKFENDKATAAAQDANKFNISTLT